MKVRIEDEELERAVHIALSVTRATWVREFVGTRALNVGSAVVAIKRNVLQQLRRYSMFRDASDFERASPSVPLFAEDYGCMRAREQFEDQERRRKAERVSNDVSLTVVDPIPDPAK